MNKKLPKVYANQIDKKISNNKRVDYSGLTDQIEVLETRESKIDKIISSNEKNINQKINDIFNSPKYVYKVEVKIKLKDKTVVKKIIGQNQNQLITFDNELIPISDIIDIDFAK